MSWWNPVLSCSVPLGMWLFALPRSPCCRCSLSLSHYFSSCLGYQIDCPGIIVLAFTLPLFYLVTPPKNNSSDASDLDMPKKSCKVLPLMEKECMYGEKHGTHRTWCSPWFQVSTRGLGMYPLEIRGTTVNIVGMKWSEFKTKTFFQSQQNH